MDLWIETENKIRCQGKPTFCSETSSKTLRRQYVTMIRSCQLPTCAAWKSLNSPKVADRRQLLQRLLQAVLFINRLCKNTCCFCLVQLPKQSRFLVWIWSWPCVSKSKQSMNKSISTKCLPWIRSNVFLRNEAFLPSKGLSATTEPER